MGCKKYKVRKGAKPPSISRMAKSSKTTRKHTIYKVPKQKRKK